MNTAIALLLQTAMSLLTNVGQNADLPYAIREQAVLAAEHAIQISTQAEAMSRIGFSVPKNTSIWPTIGDLYQTAYRASDGKWVPLGKGVQLITSSISFGDINNDGLDDATAVVVQTASDGSTRYALAAMLNQDNILFNIADFPLGSAVQVHSHSVENNQIVLDMKIGNAAEQTYHYELLGNQLIKD